MLELTVAALGSAQYPAGRFQLANEVPNLRDLIVAQADKELSVAQGPANQYWHRAGTTAPP